MEKIEIAHLTKMEGHAKLTLSLDRKSKKVRVVSLDVFESPRYFEAFIRGRPFREVPYLAGRICGVCNVAHLIGSMLAIENGLGLEVSEQTKRLRELMVMGGILHSHTLHLYLLALPDYLGYGSVLDMTGKHLGLIERALRLKEVGNEIVAVIGGRAIHPISSVIGGFTKLPEEGKLKELIAKLKEARSDALKTLELFSSLELLPIEFKTDFFALKNEDYSFTEGVIMSLSGTSFRAEQYKRHLKERVVSHSSSKHVTIGGKSFMVGPLARLNINSGALSKSSRALLSEMGLALPNFFLFSANLARALEIVHCIDRSIQLLEGLEIKKERVIEAKMGAGEGVSATEAPRGLLYHHYRLDGRGRIRYVNIIPPTTQNVKNIEEAIKTVLPTLMKLPKRKMILELEKLIRAYDPCFSCSSHFLEVNFL